jgi:DNA-binding IclR family transcriptional regulator
MVEPEDRNRPLAATVRVRRRLSRGGTEALYVERLGGVRSVRVVSRPGGTLPLHAVGKILLASLRCPCEIRCWTGRYG